MSVEPDAEVPVLLAGVRDEFVARPWMSPGAYWPEHPDLLGGRDLLGGGTWLAVNPPARRVAALLNGRGRPAALPVRLSRGDLPLLAAEAGEMPPVDLSRYDPFYLVVAGLDGVRLWTWNGEKIAEEKLPRGLHVIVNTGLPADEENERVAHFRPRFAAAPRPEYVTEGSPERFWGEWLPLASGDNLLPDDPRTLIVRHVLPDGRVYASLSVTLAALAEHGVRYDFLPFPEDPRTWHSVEMPPEGRG
ncbi:NRDE family protein [Acrocarpospora phusangensis]|uniref:NRDE family protein n=1 Tax=Acrocarpospora phusangensis TaxID=1070424 RepID=UPI001EF2BF5A|nr:NRDE family protein [Acrocarpospora phusangensis]